MICILYIESSVENCSVAVSIDGKLVWNKENNEAFSHSSVLGAYASDAIRYVHENHFTLSAVAVSVGPGSYTGLRIGVSLAKGLCYGLEVPLIAIPTLKIMATRFIPASSYLCPMIDARRMEVYAALYDGNLNEIESVRATVIDENSYSERLSEHPIVFFGNGSDKCKTLIRSSNAVFADNVYPLASDMIGLADAAFMQKEFVDTAYFEPLYVKEFQATVPKNKVIRL